MVTGIIPIVGLTGQWLVSEVRKNFSADSSTKIPSLNFAWSNPPDEKPTTPKEAVNPWVPYLVCSCMSFVVFVIYTSLGDQVGRNIGRSEEDFLGDRIGIYGGFYGGFYGDLWGYIYIYIHAYIYIYDICMCMYICIYIYMAIWI